MDTATLNGKTYVKAAKAARDVGYTADYVGQLCRQGKIDAVTLGKAWYVREGAVAEHKQNNKRKNTGATRKELERQIQEEVARRRTPQVSYPQELSSHRYETSVQYVREVSDLIPTPVRRAAEPAEKNDVEEMAHNMAISDSSAASVAETEEEHAREEPAEITLEPDISPKSEVALAPEHDTSAERVPIRRLNTAGPRRTVPPRRTHVAPAQEQGNKPFFASLPLDDTRNVPLLASEAPQAAERRITPRRPLVPMVVVTAMLLLALTLGVFLQTTWTYTEIAGESNLQTTYGFASVGTVMEELRNMEF